MFYIIIILWVSLDLFTKHIAKINLLAKKNLIGDFLYLKYTENIWIAFSIQITWMFLKVLTIGIILIIFLYYLTQEKNRKILQLDIAFWLILSGAIWNWYERLFNNKVADFIWIKHFSIFNVADIFLSLWIIIYIIYILYPNRNK